MARALIAVGAALALVFAGLGLVVFLTRNEDHVAVDNLLGERSRARSSSRRADGQDVDLARRRDFDWDRVLLVEPGTPLRRDLASARERVQRVDEPSAAASCSSSRAGTRMRALRRLPRPRACSRASAPVRRASARPGRARGARSGDLPGAMTSLADLDLSLELSKKEEAEQLAARRSGCCAAPAAGRPARRRHDRPAAVRGLRGLGRLRQGRRDQAPRRPCSTRGTCASLSSPRRRYDEKRHHYLWRFWPRLPGWGGMAVFDRSWYGRVLVERVEGFATGSSGPRLRRDQRLRAQRSCARA